jgi:hypothetical protein
MDIDVPGNRAITLMMEAASTSETAVNFYQATRRNNLEDIHLHTRRRENLKYHFMCLLLVGKYIYPELPAIVYYKEDKTL